MDINSNIIKLNYKNTKYYISKARHINSLTSNSIEFEEILTNIPNICLANLKNKKKIYKETNLKDLD